MREHCVDLCVERKLAVEMRIRRDWASFGCAGRCYIREIALGRAYRFWLFVLMTYCGVCCVRRCSSAGK